MTTRFKGGLADGVTLLLQRAPLFLRAVKAADKKWDALDQPTDRPEPNEVVVAYRKVSDDGAAFIDFSGKGGRRAGMRCTSATYEYLDLQPPDEALRDSAKWRAWCEAQP